MIRLFSALLLLLPFFTSAQSNKGISFRKESWNEILQLAKKEKKIIFLDAYTTWCGPCTHMSKNVFTKAEVGNFFNQNFINAKIDMESGEGPGLAKRYDVTAYPTLLFLNGDGKVLHKVIGYQEAAAFIISGRDALDPAKQYYTLRDAFSKGNINDDQLYRLAVSAANINDPSADKFISAYLSKTKDCLTESCINLMLQVIKDPANPYFSFLSKNEKAASAVVGSAKVSGGLDQIAFTAVTENLSENEPTKSAVAMIEAGMKKYRPTRSARKYGLAYGMYITKDRKEDALYKEYLVKYVDEFGDEMGWNELNQYAWDFFEKEKDKSLLQSALDWALKSISKESNFYNNDTAAQLYYKLGKKRRPANMQKFPLEWAKKPVKM